jgi:hypothetical protein
MAGSNRRAPQFERMAPKKFARNCPLLAKGASLECVIMKKLVLIAAVLFAGFSATAQVKVEVHFDGEQFIANEPLIARVRIVNDSGTTLRFGDTPDWLGFAIESLEGPYVRALRPPKTITEPFNVESSHTANVRVDLAPAFDLTKTGRYKVTATVKVPSFGTSFASPAKTFFIVTGTRRWEKQFGAPSHIAPPDSNGLPELRKYMLIEALSGKETRFYVRVTDKFESNIRVIPIGTLVSFSKPEPQIDKWSNLHVLYQIGARAFTYFVVNPDGLLIARETHEISDSRPYMATTDEGRIVIRGGNRRPTVDDIPPYDAAQLPQETEEPVPAVTDAPATNKAAAKKSSSAVNAKDKKKR